MNHAVIALAASFSVSTLCVASLLQAPSTPPVSDADGPPLQALQPKRVTGVEQFLSEHPDYDGTGVTVAIFDTGVDPGAPGLQVTPDGRPKVIDVIDASGSGDVDTSTFAELDDDGNWIGLTGRTMSPGDDWSNPSGDYRIGIKAAWELFPPDLVERLVEERHLTFEEEHHALLEAARDDLLAWDAAYDDPSVEAYAEREELAARVEALEFLGDSYRDPGPLYDCVVFHDGDVWRAAVDTNEDGSFDDEALMTNFRDELEFATFDDASLLNFALNIYEDGDVLSIVADCDPHGTHVAGIVGAYNPDAPELNGMAPGVQIVSVKIGDTRVQTSSTNTGEVRGLIASLEHDVDLINMSYGGPSPFPNEGRVNELFQEIVDEHGVIFVASAGNEGPALTTVGGPGGTTTSLIGVGAAVTPEMMEVQYSLHEPYEALQYTWSSRGPTSDGHLGVEITAPGGAISPIPNWTLQHNTLMNGTSMSAPNACGCIALLLSGLKDQGIAYSPHTVKRALANTAEPIAGGDPFAHGPGMIQVPGAWEHLTHDAAARNEAVRFDVAVTWDGHTGRGVYLRDACHQTGEVDATVVVTPQWRRDADNREKVALQRRIRLESTVGWVEAPEHLQLMQGGRNFGIQIDPTRLHHGVHFGEVLGFDIDDEARGPLFRIPVTATVPESLDEDDDWQFAERVRLDAGQIERFFFEVPAGATWASMAIRRTDDADARRRLVLHTVQLADDVPYVGHELQQYLWFDSGDSLVRSFDVRSGATLEVVMAHYWSNLGDSSYEFMLSFHGIRPDAERIFVDGNVPVTPVSVEATIRDETIAPDASLTLLQRAIACSDADVRPLGDARDVMPLHGKIYEMVQTYEFTLDADATVSMSPAPLLVGEDEFGSLITMLFDDANQLIAVMPDELPLAAGSYVAKFHMRHTDAATLEGISANPMLLHIELDRPIRMQVTDTPLAAVYDVGSVRGRDLAQGETAQLYLVNPGWDAWPAGAVPGDVLLGAITFGDARADVASEGVHPDGYELVVSVPTPMALEDDAAPSMEPAVVELESDAALMHALYEARLDWAAAHVGSDDVDLAAVLEPILNKGTRRGERSAGNDSDPTWAMSRRAQLILLAHAQASEGDDSIDGIIHAADAVLASVDKVAVRTYLSEMIDENDAAELAEQLLHELEYESLVDAFEARAEALAARADETGNTGDIEAFEETYRALKRWADVEGDDRFMQLRCLRHELRDEPGRALLEVMHAIEAAPTDQSLQEQRLALLYQLDWALFADAEERWMVLRFPVGYPLF